MFKLLRLCLILAACLFLAQGVRADFDVKVVSSNTSQYERGKTLILKDDEKITLENGEKITLEHNGIEKPFSGYFSELVKTLKRLFVVKRGDLSKLWQVDILIDEVYCYEHPEQLVFGRSYFDALQKTTLHFLTPVDVTVILPADETQWQWPSNRLPIISGQKYELQINNDIYDTKEITLYQLSPKENLSSNIHKAIWMLKKTCDRQARLFELSSN